MLNSQTVAEFLSPLGNRRGGLRTDFDALRRERVLVVNDTINAVSRAGEAYVSMENADGINHAGELLDVLLAELEEAILEDPRE